MIAFLRGIIEEKNIDSVTLDVGGVGYEVFMPVNMTAKLPGEGSEVKIYTYLNVREDAMQLFGFTDKISLDSFKLLITVNGVGPKAALSILGELDADALRVAVITDDDKSISKANGIGPKTAKRIIVDLKDKIDLEAVYEAKLGEADESASVRKEACEVLAALGYSQSAAYKAVSSVEAEGLSVDKLVSAALKNMSPI